MEKLKVLNENGDIHTGYGRVTLGILLFQDLAVIPMLLMISIFIGKNDHLFFSHSRCYHVFNTTSLEQPCFIIIAHSPTNTHPTEVLKAAEI